MLISNRLFLILTILFVTWGCQSGNKVQTTFIERNFIAEKSKTYLSQENNIGDFITKTRLSKKALYIHELNQPVVNAYLFNDSTFVSYEYDKRPINFKDFDITEESLFLFSATDKTIIELNKNGDISNEISLSVSDYEIPLSFGESLFHFNEIEKQFFIGLKSKNSGSRGIETIGIFDQSGKLISTFGDFIDDNDEAIPGFILSNGAIRSKIINDKLYVLKKESSHLYCFNMRAELIKSEKLPIKIIPAQEKELNNPAGIIKDQVMDFYISEDEEALVYTYITDTGDFMGQKSPSKYLAYKKWGVDTVQYAEGDFMTILDMKGSCLYSLNKNKQDEEYFLQELTLNF